MAVVAVVAVVFGICGYARLVELPVVSVLYLLGGAAALACIQFIKEKEKGKQKSVCIIQLICLHNASNSSCIIQLILVALYTRMQIALFYRGFMHYHISDSCIMHVSSKNVQLSQSG